MHESVLNDKVILLVDDEPDVLDVLKEEILAAAPNCIVHTAVSFERAVELLSSYTYDLVILDIMGVRGFDLLQMAVERPRPVPVVMLTGKVLSPESLARSIKLGARAYLPKEKLGGIVPFLNDVMMYEYGAVWRRIFKQLEGFLHKSWGPYWQQSDEVFWKEFEKRIMVDRK